MNKQSDDTGRAGRDVMQLLWRDIGKMKVDVKNNFVSIFVIL
jgi:hypothetical protein